MDYNNDVVTDVLSFSALRNSVRKVAFNDELKALPWEQFSVLIDQTTYNFWDCRNL